MYKYNGILLNASQQQILINFEKITGKIIPHLKTMDATSFGFSAKNKQVTGLSFFKQGLTYLQPEISDLKNLETLYLINNKLKTLPKQIGSLKNLQHLYLNLNQINYLPKEIGNLSSLLELSVNSNQFTDVYGQY